jgi:hypothetical protein
MALGHHVNVSFCLLAALSTHSWSNLRFVNLQLVNLPFYQFDKLFINSFINLPFHLLAFLSTYHFINLLFCQLAIWSPWFWSTSHFLRWFFNNLPLSQFAVLPSCYFDNFLFCHLAFSSICSFVDLPFFDLSFHRHLYQLALSLAPQHSA